RSTLRDVVTPGLCGDSDELRVRPGIGAVADLVQPQRETALSYGGQLLGRDPAQVLGGQQLEDADPGIGLERVTDLAGRGEVEDGVDPLTLELIRDHPSEVATLGGAGGVLA